MASFMDGVPQDQTFLARLNYLYYDGEIDANRRIPIAGLSTLGAEAKSTALGLTLLWRPPVDIGEKWSWAMSATIPYVWMDVEANVVAPLPGGGATSVRRGSEISGLGELKWLHEFETKNRLEGDYIWFKLIHKF